MPRPQTTTVAIAHSQHGSAHCLKAYLESCPDVSVVGVAPSGAALLHHVDDWAPQVVLLDMPMPHVIDGTQIIRRIRAQAPAVRIIVCAPVGQGPMLRVLRAGAVGCIRSSATPAMLLAAIRAVASGNAYVDPLIARQMVRAAYPEAHLTSRELDILWHVALGRSSHDVAMTLGLSQDTVKMDLSVILAKVLMAKRTSMTLVQTLQQSLASSEAGSPRIH